MDAFETIAEKTALAERFGLRIPYLTMNKKEYLSLVDHLAGLEGLDWLRLLLLILAVGDLVTIPAVWIVLKQRMKEIEGGELDAARKY